MASILQVISSLVKKPMIAAILGVIAGLTLGLIVGWGIWPVEWTDATPQALEVGLQQDHLRMTIDSFSINGDHILAMERYRALGSNASQVFLSVKQDPGNLDQNAILAFEQLIQASGESIDPAAQPPEEEGASSFNSVFISVAGILILGVIIFGAFYFIRKVYRPRSGDVSAAMQAAEVTRQTEKTDFQSMGLAPPVTQTMTTYVLGDDLYDESFSIDTQGGDFLGEYGVGVSETIGVGDPKKVTALEIWLFDKNDIKTATKVLMSAHAFEDANLRARLEAKGELVLLEPQGQIILETATLQLLVTVNDLEYGDGALPPDSYFERVTLELAIWPKEE